MKVLKIIGPIGHVLGLIPLVGVFTMHDLAGLPDGVRDRPSMAAGQGQGLFMVAKTAG